MVLVRKSLIFVALLSAQSSIAAEPQIKASLAKTSLKSNESLVVKYILLNSSNRRVSPANSGNSQIQLKSYSDSDCNQNVSDLGSSIAYSAAQTGSYSLSPGTYYVKPYSVGYSGACMGPISVLDPSVPFEKLVIEKGTESNNKVPLLLSWKSNSDQVAVSSAEKASLSFYSNSSCTSRVSKSRIYSLYPKNGTSSILIPKPGNGIYVKAKSGSISSSCMNVTESSTYVLFGSKFDPINAISRAVIWVNGQKQILGEDGVFSGFNTKPIVSGGSFYIGGSAIDPISQKELAVLWINGQKTVLDENDSVVEAFTVENGKIYSMIKEYSIDSLFLFEDGVKSQVYPSTPGNYLYGIDIHRYNNQSYLLTSEWNQNFSSGSFEFKAAGNSIFSMPSNFFNITNIVSSEGILYFGAADSVMSSYWNGFLSQNGTRNYIFPNYDKNSYPMDIKKVGDKLYMLYNADDDYGHGRAHYIEKTASGQTTIDLSPIDENTSSIGNVIAIEGSNVYVAGNYYNTAIQDWSAIMFVNGQPSVLDPNLQSRSEAIAIAVKNGTVYVLVREMYESGIWKYVLFKNGVKTPINIEDYDSSSGAGEFVSDILVL